MGYTGHNRIAFLIRCNPSLGCPHLVKTIADEIISYGVEEVWVVENVSIKDFQEDIHANLVYEIIKEKKPEIFPLRVGWM